MNKSIINLIPHTLNIVCGNETLTIEPSGIVARVSTIEDIAGNINGIPVISRISGKVENLPEIKEGIIYLVSSMVLSCIKNRTDIYAPDTGSSAIRENGKIKAVTQLVSVLVSKRENKVDSFLRTELSKLGIILLERHGNMIIVSKNNKRYTLKKLKRQWWKTIVKNAEKNIKDRDIFDKELEEKKEIGLNWDDKLKIELKKRNIKFIKILNDCNLYHSDFYVMEYKGKKITIRKEKKLDDFLKKVEYAIKEEEGKKEKSKIELHNIEMGKEEREKVKKMKGFSSIIKSEGNLFIKIKRNKNQWQLNSNMVLRYSKSGWNLIIDIDRWNQSIFVCAIGRKEVENIFKSEVDMNKLESEKMKKINKSIELQVNLFCKLNKFEKGNGCWVKKYDKNKKISIGNRGVAFLEEWCEGQGKYPPFQRKMQWNKRGSLNRKYEIEKFLKNINEKKEKVLL